MAGLLEYLNEGETLKHDIYLLEGELDIDSNHLLQLTEAVEFLGFAVITKGDIELTPLGQTFAEASILARKEIFATRVRRVPIMRWLLKMLRSSYNNELKREVIFTALSLDFPDEDADRQVQTLIAWGRYAELLAYDDGSETISLEPEMIREKA